MLKTSYRTLSPNLILRLSVKGMSDTVDREDLMPSLLVFGVIPSLPVINKPVSSQKEIMAAIILGRAEMSTITVELRITQALKS